MTKASDILSTGRIYEDGHIVHYLHSSNPEFSKHNRFKTKEDADSLLSKWDSVDALEERIGELETVLNYIIDQQKKFGRDSSNRAIIRIEMDKWQSIQQTTKTK